MLPDFIPKEAWEAYLLMRKQMGKKHQATEYAQKLLINKLTVWKAEGADVEAIINQSIERSWTGLFPVQQLKIDKQASAPSGLVEKTKALIKTYEEPIARAGAGYEEFRKQVKNIVRH